MSEELQEKLNDIYEVAELKLDCLFIDLDRKYRRLNLKADTLEYYYIHKLPKSDILRILEIHLANSQFLSEILTFTMSLK